MDFRTIISLLSIVISTYVAVYVYYYNKKRDKKQMCLQFYTIWSSDQMYKHRRRVYDWLNRNMKNDSMKMDYGFSRIEMEKNDPDVNNSVGIVSHFVADLNSLIQHNSIDSHLAKNLFWDTALSDWFKHFEEAYCSQRFNNTTANIEWYKKYMRPLKLTMEASQIEALK